MAENSRAGEHGEDQRMGGESKSGPDEENLVATGRLSIVHCHECWQYTDDLVERNTLLHEATAIIINAASTPAIEQTESFKAADAYLARRFASAGKPGPTATPDDRWKL